MGNVSPCKICVGYTSPKYNYIDGFNHNGYCEEHDPKLEITMYVRVARVFCVNTLTMNFAAILLRNF